MGFITISMVLCSVIYHMTIDGAWAQNSTCDPVVMRRCSDTILSSHFDFDHLAIPPQSIEATCKPVFESNKCVEDFFANCDVRGIVKEEYVTEGYKIFLETCNMFQTRYLPHYNCYAKLNDGYETCLNEIEKISMDIGGFQSFQENEKKKFCCELKGIYTCVLGPTERDCGLDAAKALKEVLDKQLPPFLHKSCESYMNQCPKTPHESAHDNHSHTNEIDSNGGVETQTLVSLVISMALAIILCQW